MSRNQREGKFDGKHNGRFCRLSPETIKMLRELREFVDGLNMTTTQPCRANSDGAVEGMGDE